MDAYFQQKMPKIRTLTKKLEKVDISDVGMDPKKVKDEMVIEEELD